MLLSRLLEKSLTLSEISFLSISNEGLMQIAASNCGHSLRMIKARFSNNSLEAIQSLCQACPKLLHLSLDFSFALIRFCSNELILTIARYCPYLEVLSTHGLYMTDTAVKALANIHTLKELNLLKSHAACSSQAVQCVLKSNPHIERIYLRGSYIDDALVRCIGCCSGNLKILTVFKDDLPIFNENALQDLFRGCPLLEVVKLRQQGGISIAILRAIFACCHHLIDLGVAISEAPDLLVLHAEPVLQTLYPSLSKLQFAGGDVADRALRDIFTYCTNLQEVKLDHCITDATMKVLVQHCAMINILELTNCKRLSIAGILLLATNSSNLIDLSIWDTVINNEVLIQLSLYCHNLSSLRLNGGYVMDEGIMCILERCTCLTILSIRNNMIPHPLHPILDLMQQGLLYPHIEFMLW